MNELAYDKEDLNQLLKRHTGQDPDCGCNCPYTGHSIIMLIQFIGIENDFPEWLVSNAAKLYKKIANKGCIVGDRKITAAAIVYLVYLLQGENIPVNSRRLTQERLAEMFWITEVGLRNRYRHIHNFYGFDKSFWDEFKGTLPYFRYISPPKKEKSLEDIVVGCLSCGYAKCRCEYFFTGKMTRHESQRLQTKWKELRKKNSWYG